MATPDAPSDATQRAAEWWDQDFHEVPGVQWVEAPGVQANLNLRATGDEAQDWISHSSCFLHAIPKPLRALSLACGTGVIERALRQRDICQRVDGIDISEASVRTAREMATVEGLDGLEYWTADLNAVALPRETYDIVYAHAALHHVFQLERLVDQVRETLKPGGYFVVFDYVGPSQMQFPRPHLELADSLIQMIPRQHRRNLRLPGYKYEAPRLTLSALAATDPSEAIRAREVVPVVSSRFEITYFRSLGGTLLLLVLNEVAGNFKADDPIAMSLLDGLVRLDNALVDAGILPSYHVYMIGQKTPNELPIQTAKLPQMASPSPGAAVTVSEALALFAQLASTVDEGARSRFGAECSSDTTSLARALAERERQLSALAAERDGLLAQAAGMETQAHDLVQQLDQLGATVSHYQLVLADKERHIQRIERRLPVRLYRRVRKVFPSSSREV